MIAQWISRRGIWQTRLLFFAAGLLEDFMYIAWISLALRGQILAVVCVVFAWQYMRSLYFLVPAELITARKLVFYEILGNALGAGLSLYLMPIK